MYFTNGFGQEIAASKPLNRTTMPPVTSSTVAACLSANCRRKFTPLATVQVIVVVPNRLLLAITIIPGSVTGGFSDDALLIPNKL
jgi:hypothetical protein